MLTPSSFPQLNQLFHDSALQLKQLIELRYGIIVSGSAMTPQARQSINMLTKHILVLGKFFRRLSHASHSRFVQLPMCNELVLFYWSHVVDATGIQPSPIAGASKVVVISHASHPLSLDSNEALYPIRFLVQGMVLFKENLSQWSPTRKDGTPNPNGEDRCFLYSHVLTVIF